MGWYQILDGLTQSPAERARDECAAVIRETEDAVAIIRADIAAAASLVEANLPKFRSWSVGDCSEGLFASDFESALDRWKVRADALVGLTGALSWAVKDLENKLVSMRSRKNYLDSLCVIEDRRELEYKEWEI